MEKSIKEKSKTKQHPTHYHLFRLNKGVDYLHSLSKYNSKHIKIQTTAIIMVGFSMRKRSATTTTTGQEGVTSSTGQQMQPPMNSSVAQQQANQQLHVDRDVHWTMTSIGTTLSLIALLSDFIENEQLHEQTSQHKWAASAIIIALILSWISLFFTIIIRSKFVGSLLEGSMILVVCGFWAAVMPVFMSPNSDIAVVSIIGGISNANLYFFTWFSFISSFVTLLQYIKEKFSADLLYCNTTIFGCLCVSSCVVAVSAGRMFRFLSCDAPTGYDELFNLDVQCRRTTFAASLGTSSGLGVALWLLITIVCQSSILYIFEFFVSIITVLAWSCGVTFITFGGRNAPATQVGNLYFATWGSFVLSILIFVKCTRNFKRQPKEDDTELQQQQAAAAAAAAAAASAAALASTQPAGVFDDVKLNSNWADGIDDNNNNNDEQPKITTTAVPAGTTSERDIDISEPTTTNGGKVEKEEEDDVEVVPSAPSLSKDDVDDDDDDKIDNDKEIDIEKQEIPVATK